MTNPMDSTDKPCFYCGEPIAGHSASSLFLDLGVAFFHADGSGKLRWHHNSCLLKRLGEIKEKPMEAYDILELSKDNPVCEHGYPMVPLYTQDHLVCRKYVGIPEPQPYPNEGKQKNIDPAIPALPSLLNPPRDRAE